MLEPRIRPWLAADMLLAAAFVQPGPSAADTAVSQPVARQKVIFHVGDADPAKWTVALNNVFNAHKDPGAENVDIEVVAIGAGIRMPKLESQEGGRIAEAVKGGIKVVACGNSMQGQQVTREDVLPGIGYVPAGVVELMQRQREGYAHIRP